MKKEDSSQKQKLYDRDYFESEKKRIGAPYSWEAKRYYLEIIANTLDEAHPRKVLEVGCAKGFLVELLRQRGIEAFGVDVSRYAIEQAPDTIRDKLFVLDVERGRFPFSDNFFDCIIGIEIMEHITDFDHLLREYNRVLENGGFLFFTTPMPGSWDARGDPSHVSVFAPDSWITLFKSYGFAQLQKQEYNKFIKTFIRNYKRFIHLVPAQRKIAKVLLRLGWFGTMLRSQLQVYVNFFSPWKTTQILLFKKDIGRHKSATLDYRD